MSLTGDQLVSRESVIAGQRSGPLRVLAVAYACDPERGSEFGVGWGWVRHVAERHNVVVLTADFNRSAIERRLRVDTVAGQGSLRFVYVPNRRWHYRPQGVWLKVESSGLKPLMNLAYQHWLGDALKLAQNEISVREFDLVHLITYVGFRFPGKFWKLGLPFVWGPVGGLENTPWRLLPLMGPYGAAYYAARNLVNSGQVRILRGPKAAFAASQGAVIAATSGMQRAIWRHYRVDSTVIPEVGPPEVTVAEPSRREDGEPLRISWSGTHTPGKALPILLRAVAAVEPSVPWRLEVLGDGPERNSWQTMAQRLGINDRCEWPGWLARADSLEHIRRSHVFVITSLKDLTSNVVLEALSLGVPVVCLRHCGFADLVNEDCGVPVPLAPLARMEADITAAIERLAADETERQRLSQGALGRRHDYSWRKKMDELNAIYSSAVAGCRARVGSGGSGALSLPHSSKLK